MSLELWDKLKSVPANALKKIEAERLKGRSDISPVWRYERMTDIFGLCGVGWKFEIDSVHWVDAGAEKIVYVQINLYIKDENKWSAPIPGFGGDFAIQQERTGLHTNDEALKMALTDALGYAMQKLGVAADVYRGLADDSKYGREPAPATTTPPKQNKGQDGPKESEKLLFKMKHPDGTYTMETIDKLTNNQIEWYAKNSQNVEWKKAAGEFISQNIERFADENKA